VLFKALADPSRRKLLEAANLVATVRSGREKLHFLNLSGDGQILDAGEIVEAESPRRLVIRWQHQNKPELKAEGDSLCTMELEPSGTAVKLSITHTIEREPSKFIAAVSGGWPKIISNLKSLLETGSAVLRESYPTSK
jgi:uncharacterized protein YndB with AHSA1/START domain